MPSRDVDGPEGPYAPGHPTRRVATLKRGAATTLDEALQNVQHRSAGTSGVDTLPSSTDRASIAQFLRSIDAASRTIP